MVLRSHQRALASRITCDCAPRDLHDQTLDYLRMSTASQDLEKNTVDFLRLADPPHQKPRREVWALTAKRWQDLRAHTLGDDGTDLPRLRPDRSLPPRSQQHLYHSERNGYTPIALSSQAMGAPATVGPAWRASHCERGRGRRALIVSRRGDWHGAAGGSDCVEPEHVPAAALSVCGRV
jgi:hypothetical protein